MTPRLADAEPSPDVFAAVMATGILSIGARDHGYRWASDALGVVATVALAVLVAVTVITAARRNLRGDLAQMQESWNATVGPALGA